MIYRYSDTIPADTAKVDAQSKKIMLAAGRIVLFDVVFPYGCHGLAHVSVWKGGHQVFPTNPDEDFHGDGLTPAFPESYDVKEGDVWYLKTWSDGTRYPHTITVRLAILPPEAATPWMVMRDFVEIVKTLIGL